MAILSDQVKRQLQDRFAQQLSGPVQLTLYTRPGTGRLILPSGFGCATLTLKTASSASRRTAAATPSTENVQRQAALK